MDSAAWALAFDLLGVFFFAVSGCMMATERNYDIVGSVLLGALTGIGGGVIRDVILGHFPNSLAHPVYLLPPILAAAVVYFLMPAVRKMRRTLLMFDAAGLALFCVTGTLTAIAAGVSPVPAAVLGTTTAIGGGLLRDTVANVRPGLFDRHDIYAVPAMLGASLVALLWWLGVYSTIAGVVVAIVVFGLRVLALRFQWRVPLAASSRNP